MKYHGCKWFIKSDNLLDVAQLLLITLIIASRLTNEFEDYSHDLKIHDLSKKAFTSWVQIVFLFINLLKWLYFGRCVPQI